MADPSQPTDNFEKTVSAVTALVNAVPVYQDLAQPAAREIGKSLVTVGKTINIILAPLAAVVWGYERIQAFVETRVAEKLRNVPATRLATPSPNVAGPVLEALRFAGHEEALRELYANLLASSLDSATARNAHPAFVEIIKNMTPDEARMLRSFSERTDVPLLNARLWNQDNTAYTVELRNVSNLGERANCQHPDLVPSYLDNLVRLGLIQNPGEERLSDDAEYEPLERLPEIAALRAAAEAKNARLELNKRVASLTTLGHQFCVACVLEHAEPTKQ